jgi:translocation and assembly module TamA
MSTAKRLKSRLLLLCILVAVSRNSGAADPQPYKVDIASTGNGELDSTLKATSDLQGLRTSAPVGPFGLIARARSDVDRLTTAAESFGYYQCKVLIKINGIALNDPQIGDALSSIAKGQTAQVAVNFTLGPVYTLRKIEIDGQLPPNVDARSIIGLRVGEPVVAETVLAGGSRLLANLQEQGYAFAKVDAPVAYEAAEAPVLDLNYHVEAGARVNIGEIHIEGLQRIHESLLRKRLLLHTGDRFNPASIDRARKDLLSMNVFGQVSVQIGTAADATGGVPVTFKIRERLRHAVNLNAAFSSDLGGSGGATWTDRNVFGNAEQLTVNASLIDLGGSDSTGAGYDTGVKYLIPDFLQRDQSLQFSVTALKQSLQAYDQTSRSAGVTLARKLSSVWSVSAGLSATDDHIIQGATYNYTLLALPVSVAYDSTDVASPLDDPRHGYRASLQLSPTEAIGHPNSTFLIAQVKAAGYFDLRKLFGEDPGRTVLAVRALAGQALGASEFSLPPDQRFYGGGSGTIRGYAYQAVGPIFPDITLAAACSASPAPAACAEPLAAAKLAGYPIGGTAITAGSMELRQRFGASWGAAAFIDAGQVSAKLKVIPDELRVGIGMGVRYYTPIGPVRLDVAVPLQRRASNVSPQNDGAFQVYIGLGPSF